MNDANGTPTESEAENASEANIFPNLQVSAERVSDVEQRLDVEIPWEDVKSKLDEAYKELRRGVALKGFRKGKVPQKMIAQLFGKHVNQEVSQRLVQESIEQATKEADIKPVGEPKLEYKQEGLEDGENFKYSATMEVVPEVDPQDYFGLEVRAQRVPITDEDVETALLTKQQELTAYEAVEGRDTQHGDVLLVDVMGKAGDEVIDLEQKTVELSETMPNEPLLGLAAALTGIPCDQEEADLVLDLPVSGAEGDNPPTQKARLLVTIHDVKQKVVPALDDELAKDTGEAQTLDELRGVLRKKLEEQSEEQAQQEAKQLLVKQILEKNDIPVVPALVERYLDQRVKLQKMLMGMNPEQPSNEDQMLKDHLRQDAEETIKSGILLEAICKKEKVEVHEADLEKRLAEMAAQREQNVARVRAEYEKDGQLDALRRRIEEEKTLDLLASKANIIIEEKAEEQEEEEAAQGEEAEPQTESVEQE